MKKTLAALLLPAVVELAGCDQCADLGVERGVRRPLARVPGGEYRRCLLLVPVGLRGLVAGDGGGEQALGLRRAVGATVLRVGVHLHRLESCEGDLVQQALRHARAR